MAIIGELEIVSIKVDSAYLPIGCLVGHSFSEETDMLDTTTQDDGGWETSIPNRQRANIGLNGLVTSEVSSLTSVTFADLRNMKRNKELVEWKIARASGYNDYGEGYITSINESVSVNELISFDASIKVEGNPNNEFYNFYNNYWDLVTSDSGVIENEQCLKNDIKNIFE